MNTLFFPLQRQEDVNALARQLSVGVDCLVGGNEEPEQRLTMGKDWRASESSMSDLGGSRPAHVIVGVHGSLTSLAALRVALQEARDRSAVLVPVLAWSPVGGEYAYRRAPCGPLLKVWRENASQRLVTAFDEALGGYPHDVEVRPHVIRGEAGSVLAQVAADIGNLLVIGSGRRRMLSRRWQGPTARYCLAHATCPVLLVPPPELLYDADRLARRRWAKQAGA
jgi:nucleotide-binding universal stress UspA family protein